MRCLPTLTLDTDVPFWVTIEVFRQHFDQEDFLFRESISIKPLYLDEWFYTPADGIRRFVLPTVQIVSGKTQFINGRHRTAVLLGYLENLPIAFSLQNPAAKVFLSRLPLLPLAIDKLIELPDLPIVKCLP